MLTPITEDSSRREDSGRDNIVRSEEEARAKGINVEKPQPPDEQCPYCGRTLKHEGLVLFGQLIAWAPFPEDCTCAMAIEKRKQEEEQERERKAAEAEAQRNQAMEEKINRLLGDSGIKKRFQNRTFQTFKTDTPQRKKAYRTAKAYADEWDRHREDGTGLYIEGTNGTGKTHLAAAIAMQLITERRIPVICKTAGDLLTDIKKAFDGEEATERQVLEVYKKVDLLIIDDLGKEQCTDWSISTLYSIMNDRYEDMRPTIITTNYNSDDLARALTPKGFDNLKVKAIISRLREVSQVLTMAWEDYRSSGR